MEHDRQMDLALWRYGVISPLLHRDANDAHLCDLLHILSENSYIHPIDGRHISVSAEAIRKWFYLQKKYADYEEDVADEYQKKAAVSVDLAKLEAIDRAGLGEKKANIEDIADLKSKELKIEANGIKIGAKRDTTGEKINDLLKQIDEQETKIINLEAAGVPEPEKADVMKTDEKPAEKKVTESATEKGAGEQEGQEKTEGQQ